jgi:hypothetical protein
MTDTRPILVTREQAAAVGQLIRSTGDASLGAVQPGVIRSGDALVVQLETAIAAGSSAAVLANIMRLDGDTWTDTKQQIAVRSLNGLAVSTTGRRIARRVSTYGWCVVET